jgi:hypothetical protein
MARTLVWSRLDESRMEVAHIDVDGAELRARGTQIGRRSGSFVGEIQFDKDGFVERYEGLAERVG